MEATAASGVGTPIAPLTGTIAMHRSSHMIPRLTFASLLMTTLALPALAMAGHDVRPSTIPLAAMQGLQTALESSADADASGLRRVVFNLQNESERLPRDPVADIVDWGNPDWIVQSSGSESQPDNTVGGSDVVAAPMPSPALLAGAGLMTIAGARRRRR